MISQEEWLDSTATKTLDLSEMDHLVRENQELWNKYDELKRIAAEAHQLAEESDRKLLQALKDAGKTKYHVDGLGTISCVQKAVVRVPASVVAKKRFFAYLKTLGEDVLFSMTTVNSNTLNSWYSAKMNEALEKGILGFSVPGIEEPTMRESIRFMNERKKK